MAPAQPPNIVVWDWRDAADGNFLSIVGKADVAAKEGTRLGQALQQAFPGGYGKHLHFIGHSLGTIVNRYACDYLHASFPANRDSLNSSSPWEAAQTTPHVTLLDEAEIASVVGTTVVTSTAVSAVLSGGTTAVAVGVATAATNWKSPIPSAVRWIDSYNALVGIPHLEAVNVFLPGLTTINPITQHAYPHLWYRWSAMPSLAYPSPPLGFGRSREKAGVFPPTGAGMTGGSLWLEDLGTADPLDLIRVPTFEEIAREMSAATVRIGRRVKEEAAAVASKVVQTGEAAAQELANATNVYVVKPLDATGLAVMESYETGIQKAGQISGTIIYKTGQVGRGDEGEDRGVSRRDEGFPRGNGARSRAG